MRLLAICSLGFYSTTLPDWTDADPHDTGKAARVIPYGKTEAVK